MKVIIPGIAETSFVDQFEIITDDGQRVVVRTLFGGIVVDHDPPPASPRVVGDPPLDD